MHIYNCEKIRHRQRYKAVAIDFVICPPKNKANITYNKATVKNKANIRQFWGVVKRRQTARNIPANNSVLVKNKLPRLTIGRILYYYINEVSFYL